MGATILKKLSGQQRIVLFFVVVILIPSLLLGLLAFRGIKSDHALVAQQQRQTGISAGRNIADTCNAVIQDAEEDILRWHAEQNGLVSGPLSHVPALEEYLVSNACVFNVIFFNNQYLPRMHGRNVVFIPDEFAGVPPLRSTDQEQRLIEEGWRYEFQSADLRAAGQYYSGILPQLKTSDAICATLLARARVQKKMQRVEQAIASFRRIRNSCPDFRINHQIPVAHASSLELSQLYLETGDTVSAAMEVHHLYFLLSTNVMNIGQSAFQLLAERAGETQEVLREAKQLKGHPAMKKLDSLVNLVVEREAQTQKLFAITAEITKRLNGADRNNSFRRSTVSVNNTRVGVSISPKTTNGYWVLIFDKEVILDDVMLPALMHNRQGKQWQWRLLDEDGNVLRQSGEQAPEEDFVTTVINTGAFTWTLQSWTDPVSLFSTTGFDRRNIYLLIFFIIVAILLFGLIFTYQAVNTEIRLARMKSGFISTVSHEFKSPLTSIRHMAEMLRENKVSSEERKHEYYGIMLDQSQRLSHMIENLLDFSRIEEGKKPFHFEPTPLTPFLREAVALFERRISDESFTIESSIPEQLPGCAIDRHAMTQVMHNLLDNAYKYSGDSRVINFIATSVNSEVTISVRDYGLGIPKGEIPKIFDRFYRIDDTLTSKIKGSGLGLALVKQIVAAHAGTIRVDSIPGEGSTFHVVLPILNHGYPI